MFVQVNLNWFSLVGLTVSGSFLSLSLGDAGKKNEGGGVPTEYVKGGEGL